MKARRTLNRAYRLARECGVEAEEIKSVRYRLERLLPAKAKRTPGQILGRKVDRAMSIKELDAQLWESFARYIKLRDSDSMGLGRCVTCGAIIKVWWKDLEGKTHWNKEAQCGHYVRRNHKAVKYNEKNNALQCGGCNGAKKGEEVAYRAVLLARYGEEEVLKLEAGKNIRHTESRWHLKLMLAHYTAKLAELKAQRGIE
jgi:hypothetical protein